MKKCDPGKGVRVLDQEESAFVLNSLEGRDRIAVLLGLNAGLRPSEIFVLRWNNVDFSKGTLTVYSGKTNRARLIPLSEILSTELRSYKSTCHGNRLFGSQTAKHYSRFLFGINKILRGLLSNGVSFRALRNTYAANLLEAGISFGMIAQLLGHKSINALLTNPSFAKYLGKPLHLN